MGVCFRRGGGAFTVSAHSFLPAGPGSTHAGWLQAAEVEQKARDVAVAVGSMEEAEEALEAVHGGHDEVPLSAAQIALIIAIHFPSMNCMSKIISIMRSSTVWCGRCPQGVTRKSMDSFSRSVEDTNGHIAEAEAFDGKELMEAVDEELEAVEDIVEEVTHLKDNNPIDESEIALGMMVAQSLEGGMDGGKDGGGEGEVAANDASGHPPRPPELVHRRKRHHHGAAAVHELHHKAETAAARLQSTLEKHTVSVSPRSSLCIVFQRLGTADNLCLVDLP